MKQKTYWFQSVLIIINDEFLKFVKLSRDFLKTLLKSIYTFETLVF